MKMRDSQDRHRELDSRPENSAVGAERGDRGHFVDHQPSPPRPRAVKGLIHRISLLGKSLLAFLQPILPPPPQDDDVGAWREIIFFVVFFSTLVLGGLAYLISLRVTLKYGMWTTAAVYTGAYACAVIVTLVRSIPYGIRAGIGLLICYVLGVAGLANVGLHGSGRLWLFSFSVLAALLLGLRAGLVALFLNVATIAVLGYLHQSGAITHTIPWSDTRELWVILTVSFVLACTVVTVAVGLFLRMLNAGLQKARDLGDELTQLNRRLQEEIEDRRRAEEAARSSAELFRALTEHSVDAVEVLNREGTVIYASKPCETILDLPLDEILGRSAQDFVHESDREWVFC